MKTLYHYLIMAVIMLATAQMLKGQQQHIVMNSPPVPGVYEAGESITLQPGFSFTATSGNSLTLRIIQPRYEYFEVKTPKGNVVGNPTGGTSTKPDGWGTYKYIGPDKSSSRKTQDSLDVVTNYPGAKVVGEATNKYNCHSYAWYMEGDTTAEKILMEDPTKYMTDGSYSWEASDDKGIIAVYGYEPDTTYLYPPRSIKHSAISSGNGKYISKWGDLPLVEHTLENVPKGYKTLNDSNVLYVKTYHYRKVPPTEISGSNEVCYINETFTVNYPPPGFTWEVTGPFEIKGYPQPYQVTIAKNGLGRSGGTLKVKNSNGDVVATKNIYPCLPEIEADVYPIECYDYVTFSILQIPSTGVSYSWYGVGTTLISASGNLATFYVKDGDMALVGCNLSHSSTGTTDYVTKYISPSCDSPSPSNVYPNPTKDIFTIEIDDQSTQRQAKSPTYDIRLYDGMGNPVRQTTTKSNSAQFNVLNLPNGIYYLHIYDGINPTPEVQQVVVQH